MQSVRTVAWKQLLILDVSIWFTVNWLANIYTREVRHCTSTLNRACSSNLTILEQSHHSHSIGLTRYLSTLPSPSGRSNLHAKRTTINTAAAHCQINSIASHLSNVSYEIFPQVSQGIFPSAKRAATTPSSSPNERTAAQRLGQSEERICYRNRKLLPLNCYCTTSITKDTVRVRMPRSWTYP